MPTILIIDDDQKLNELLKGFLSDFGFRVMATTHPEQGLKKLKQKAPDLVILDVMPQTGIRKPKIPPVQLPIEIHFDRGL